MQRREVLRAGERAACRRAAGGSAPAAARTPPRRPPGGVAAGERPVEDDVAEPGRALVDRGHPQRRRGWCRPGGRGACRRRRRPPSRATTALTATAVPRTAARRRASPADRACARRREARGRPRRVPARRPLSSRTPRRDRRRSTARRRAAAPPLGGAGGQRRAVVARDDVVGGDARLRSPAPPSCCDAGLQHPLRADQHGDQHERRGQRRRALAVGRQCRAREQAGRPQAGAAAGQQRGRPAEQPPPEQPRARASSRPPRIANASAASPENRIAIAAPPPRHARPLSSCRKPGRRVLDRDLPQRLGGASPAGPARRRDARRFARPRSQPPTAAASGIHECAGSNPPARRHGRRAGDDRVGQRPSGHQPERPRDEETSNASPAISRRT